MNNHSQTSPVIAALKWVIVSLVVAFPPLGLFFPPLAQAFPAIQSVTHHNLFLSILLIAIYEFLLLCIYILTQFWQQLAPEWFKELSIPLDLLIHSIFSRYSQRYRSDFYTFHRNLDVKGTGTIGAFSLEIEQVFVDLCFDPKALHAVSSNPVHFPSNLQEGRHDIWEYLKTPQQHFVVLGAPGNGKTTLLMHLGILFAHRKHLPRKWSGSRLLPLLLFLRNHATAITEDYTLADALLKQIHQWQSHVPLTWIKRELSLGHCLVLLDGLDEVADTAQRQKMVEWVQAQIATNARNRFIITSRPHGYRNNPLNGVTILEIQSFTLMQIEEFLDRWYLANEVRSTGRDDRGVRVKAQQEAHDLLHRLREKEALLELAVNPLLLTMIATVHRYRGSLPGKRIELYREICEVLLGKRQAIRGIEQDLSADQRQFVLQPLAYEMMYRETRELSYRDLEPVLVPTLSRVSSLLAPRDFLQSIENTTGLLLEREHATYGFAHLTFQEYLAAIHIRENALETWLMTHIAESWWHETIRLYCAQSDATSLIIACLIQASQSVTVLTLALECAAEARDLDQSAREYLNDLVDQGVESPDTDRRHVVGEALLARRLTQMHALKEHIFIDTSLLTCVEYQLFLDEERANGQYFQPDHWKDSTFPPGTGHAPILGVRKNDAQAFCKWLTARSTGLWRYRLPQLAEIQQIDEHILHLLSEDTGYWAEDAASPFMWGRNKPSRLIEEHWKNVLNHIPIVAPGRNHVLASTLDRDLAHELTLAIDSELTLELNHTLDCNHALDLAQDLAYIPHDDVLARALARDLTHRLDHNLDRALDRALDHAHYLDRELTLTIIYNLNRDHGISIYKRTRTYVQDWITYMRLSISLTALQERIAGTFPAYEGILLIKERVENIN